MKILIGSRIKQARELAGITQVVMAERLGVARQTFLDMESGKTKHHIETLIKIAEITNYPVAWFYEKNNEGMKFKYAVTIEKMPL